MLPKSSRETSPRTAVSHYFYSITLRPKQMLPFQKIKTDTTSGMVLILVEIGAALSMF